MGLFAARSKPMLGVDISSTAVKALELSKHGSRYRVESYSAVPLPDGAIQDKQITDVPAVAEAIANAVKSAKTSAKEVAVAVAGSAVITKVIQMPAGLSDDALEQQVLMDAEQHIPYPLEEVNLDFEIIPRKGQDVDEVDVLLAASRSDNVETRVQALKLAGLEPRIVDIEAYALENACTQLRHQMPNDGEGRTVALVDIGASNTSFTMLHDNRAVYTRDQSFGGRALTESIMEAYDLSYEEAGKAKKMGGLPDDYQERVFQPFVDGLVQTIDRSIQLFFSASPEFNEVDQILLAGGCSMIEGLNQTVQKQLSIATETANPFVEMDIAKNANPKRLQRDIPAMLIACGLALRAFE